MTAESQQPAPDERRIQDYLAGRLDDSEAERFEERMMADDDLAAEVQQALDIRAALTGVRSAGTRMDKRAPGGTLLALAAAAAVSMIALGVHWLRPPEPVFRGVQPVAGFDVEVEAAGGELRARWTPVAGAAGYELRVLSDDGRVLERIEVEAPSATLDLGGTDQPSSPSFLEVVALDELGQVLRRSNRIALIR
ncbi:MAG TPA: hypothetical protein VF200_08365 [Woeseiaceae bacterium]